MVNIGGDVCLRYKNKIDPPYHEADTFNSSMMYRAWKPSVAPMFTPNINRIAQKNKTGVVNILSKFKKNINTCYII